LPLLWFHCALDSEKKATQKVLSRAFGLNNDNWRRYTDRGITSLRACVTINGTGRSSHKVILCTSSNGADTIQGTSSYAPLHAIKNLNPRFVMMPGVCGGN